MADLLSGSPSQAKNLTSTAVVKMSYDGNLKYVFFEIGSRWNCGLTSTDLLDFNQDKFEGLVKKGSLKKCYGGYIRQVIRVIDQGVILNESFQSGCYEQINNQSTLPTAVGDIRVLRHFFRRMNINTKIDVNFEPLSGNFRGLLAYSSNKFWIAKFGEKY